MRSVQLLEGALVVTIASESTYNTTLEEEITIKERLENELASIQARLNEQVAFIASIEAPA